MHRCRYLAKLPARWAQPPGVKTAIESYMKNKISFLSLLLFLCPLDLFSQFKVFSGIDEKQFDYIDKNLEEFGFEKVTYYFNIKTQKSGKYYLYPKILLSDSIFAVSISSIQGLSNQYTFLVIYDVKSNMVIDTLGPFYDTSINAIKFKNKKGTIVRLTVRLANPPEPYDPKYTFIEYVRQNSKFVEKRSYDKY